MSAGTFAATDIALREEALYGEIRPEMVGLGFGLVGLFLWTGLLFVFLI